MKRRNVLSSLIIAAFILGGCGNTTTPNEPNTAQQTQAPAPKGFLNLEEAQKQVNFTIVIPAKLPHDMKFDHAILDIDPNTSKPRGVLLNFTSPDKQWSLEVSQLQVDDIPQFDQNAKEVTINGYKARYVISAQTAAITWQDGKLVYFTATSPHSELGTESALLDIAARFKSK